MSDFAPLSSPTPFTQQPEEAPTAGLLLRRARQSAGLHAEALAASLKVPVQKIEALEADRFDLLPDLVFVRALAASICRTLDVDAQPVLERLPRKTAPRLAHVRDRVNAPFRGPNDVPGPGWRDQLKRPPVLAMLALLAGALVLILLPQSVLDHMVQSVRSRLSDTASPVAVLVTESAPATLGAPGVVVSQGAAGPAESPVSPAVAPGLAMPPEPAPGTVVQAVSQTLVAGSASPMTGRAPAPVGVPAVVADAPAAAPSGVLVFRTSGDSWVEVRDAQGAVALRRMLAAGETADASGTPPLSITVGKVDVTQLQVRGKDFDLAAVARDNVARFQVK